MFKMTQKFMDFIIFSFGEANEGVGHLNMKDVFGKPGLAYL